MFDFEVEEKCAAKGYSYTEASCIVNDVVYEFTFFVDMPCEDYVYAGSMQKDNGDLLIDCDTTTIWSKY